MGGLAFASLAPPLDAGDALQPEAPQPDATSAPRIKKRREGVMWAHVVAPHGRRATCARATAAPRDRRRRDTRDLTSTRPPRRAT
jgi:hypothetical protein